MTLKKALKTAMKKTKERVKPAKHKLVLMHKPEPQPEPPRPPKAAVTDYRDAQGHSIPPPPEEA